MKLKEINSRMHSLLDGIPDGSFDAMCIFEDMIASREHLAAYPDEEISEDKCAMALGAAHKRLEGYPLQYILGEWEFYGMPFSVGEGVLIPRPDTETLVDEALAAIDRLYDGKPLVTADLCTGSGCIAAAVAAHAGIKADMYAVEYSGEAIPYFLENIKRNNVSVKLIRGDVCDGRLLDNFVDADGEIPLDIVISNPPYLTDDEMNELQREVTYEPQQALYGGRDGLDLYRAIACLWGQRIRSGGHILFEIGDRQADAVRDILTECSFADIRVIQYAGLDRVITGVKK
ncbi:MAG: peptide chain release factor N(5)-glutamine methyltransferase [Oscillospiraceae bacterium]|nr:peptide chain release factor N(5)-glutamine methyltransferase [Oscillospiraceae bacterium]